MSLVPMLRKMCLGPQLEHAHVQGGLKLLGDEAPHAPVVHRQADPGVLEQLVDGKLLHQAGACQ